MSWLEIHSYGGKLIRRSSKGAEVQPQMPNHAIHQLSRCELIKLSRGRSAADTQIPGRSDTMIDTASHKTKGSQLPKVAIRKALKGLKSVAQTTTT